MRQCFLSGVITALLTTYVVKCAEIISGPISQVVTVGQNASYECRVKGFGTWYINGQAIDPLDGDRAFEIKGFYSSISEEQDESADTVTSLGLRAEGRKESNGTKIQCYGYDTDVATSVVALLIVQDATVATNSPSPSGKDVTTKPPTTGKDGILCDQTSLGGRQGVATCTQVPITVHAPTNISATNANSVPFQHLEDYASSTCTWSPNNIAETLVGLFALYISICFY
ncbi:hypothetical protein EMCRGX_G011887 [Ephydatia muelleri]